MEIGVGVRGTAAAVKPVRDQGPGIASISSLGAAQISSEIDRIAIGITRIHQDQLVIPSLYVQQVHVGIVGIRIEGSFSRNVEFGPIQSAIGGTKEVGLRVVGWSGSNCINDAVSGLSNRKGGASNATKDVVSIGNWSPGTADIS